MTAVRAAGRPRFRLEFLDLALPGFFVLFTATMAGLTLWLFNALNPLWLLDLRIRVNWYLQNLDIFPVGWFAAAAIAGVSLCALAGLGVALALDRPAPLAKT